MSTSRKTEKTKSKDKESKEDDVRPEKVQNKKSKSSEKESEEDDVEPENVHSANKWEKVNLGDDGRKKKFLRLMGAAKKEHHGRFVIGDEKLKPHDRDSPEDEIDEKLEDQYKQGLEHKLLAGPKAHIGLGFHDDPKKVSENSKGTGDQNDEKTDDKVAEKHKLDGKTEDAPVKKKMMYNFVKASDSS